MSRCEREIVVENELGLHARPASMLVRAASQFESSVTLEKDGEPVNCKSVLALLMLAAGKGTRMRLAAEGADDAETAVETVAGLFANRFGE